MLSSWDEYTKENVVEVCKKDIVLGQFSTKKSYKRFALDSLVEITASKEARKDIEFIQLRG